MFAKWRYVYELYKEQSFTNAAKKLFISQPSLSAAIKNTEEKVGAQLFERTGHGIKLTEVGKEYIATAEKILSAENEFENKLNDIYNLESGEITVGGANYVSSYILPKIITKFSSLHPNISIKLKEANSYTLSHMLKSGEADIIIDSLDDVSELKKYPLSKEKIFLCVPKDYEINETLKKYQINPESIRNSLTDGVEAVSIDVFRNEPYILLKEENDMYVRASKIFNKKGIEPRVVFSVDQLNISYALSDSGVGLCFITDTFFKYAHHRENVVLYKIEEENDGRTLYAAHKNNKYCTKAMSEFINIAKEIIENDL